MEIFTPTDYHWRWLKTSLSGLHQAAPLGVPSSYDWANKAVVHAGNNVPDKFEAFTGWGQVFQTTESKHDNIFQLRNLQVHINYGPKLGWKLEQYGEIEGAVFNPDYLDNKNKLAVIVTEQDGSISIEFSPGLVFHFWPKLGRINLKHTDIEGILVTFQARTKNLTPLLIGAGGDYWSTIPAPWDNYKTNASVGIGQLRIMSSRWTWYGMTTSTKSLLEAM